MPVVVRSSYGNRAHGCTARFPQRGQRQGTSTSASANHVLSPSFLGEVSGEESDADPVFITDAFISCFGRRCRPSGTCQRGCCRAPGGQRPSSRIVWGWPSVLQRMRPRSAQQPASRGGGGQRPESNAQPKEVRVAAEDSAVGRVLEEVVHSPHQGNWAAGQRAER